MTLLPVSFNCPKCGSPDVVYSCTPSCCFNHVCSRCYATFEPKTTRVGEFAGDLPAAPETDPSGPTAACARCAEHTLFAVAGNASPEAQLLCVSCRALLTFALEPDEAGP